MTDLERLINTLDSIGVPYETREEGDYTDVTITGSATDKYINVCFMNGMYRYTA